MGIYKNVMELLVEEEVVRQYKLLPSRVAAYAHPVEWVAHALNQLPPLYATSEKGLHHQIERGRVKHGAEIKQAVQRALAAICRDPLRTCTPLQSPDVPFQEVLLQLRFLLNNDQLEWNSLPHAVEQALAASQNRSRQQPRRSPSLYAPVRGSSPFPPYQPEQTLAASGKSAFELSEPNPAPSLPQTSSQPATSRSDIGSDRSELFGWDDPLYHSR